MFALVAADTCARDCRHFERLLTQGLQMLFHSVSVLILKWFATRDLCNASSDEFTICLYFRVFGVHVLISINIEPANSAEVVRDERLA